jgi:hypothetical protein
MVNLLKGKPFFLLITVFTCFTALVTYIIAVTYFSHKGFELSDEAFYLYFTEHYNTDCLLYQNFGLLNKIACLGNITLFNLRIAKLVYQIIAILVFCFSVFAYLKHKQIIISNLTKTFTCILLLMSSFISYDYLPMTLSYNTWTLLLSLFIFSIVLHEFCTKVKWMQLTYSTGIGFFIFCLFLSKFPNAIVMLGIYSLILVLYQRSLLLTKFLGLLLGSLLAYLLLIPNLTFFKTVLHNYKVVVFDIAHVSSGSYIQQFSEFYNLALRLNYVYYVIIVCCMVWAIRKWNKSQNPWLYYLPLLLNFSVAAYFFKGNSEQLHNDFCVGSLFLFNVFIYYYFFKTNSSSRFVLSENVVVIMILLISPFALMLGTNNLFYYTTSQMVCLSIAGGLVGLFCFSKLDEFILPLATVFICAFVFTATYIGGVKKPYRQESLILKNYPLSSDASLTGIYESKNRYMDYVALKTIITALSPTQTHVFGFFNHIGLNYIAHKALVAETGFSDGESNMNANTYVLAHLKSNINYNLIALPESIHKNLAFKKMFESCKIYLGSNYKLMYSYTFLSTNETIHFYKKV